MGVEPATAPATTPPGLPPETLLSMREEAAGSLFFFAKGVLGFTKLNKRIHGPICSLLETEPLRKRAKIVLPRSWYKSTLCSIAYPIWRACGNPNIRILLAQNTYINSTSKLGSIQKQFEQNSLLRLLFPEILPNERCIWKSDKLELNRPERWPEATFEAAGTNTRIIGRHYDLVIEDDTVAPDLADLTADNIAPTKEGIEQAIGWHRLVPPLLTSLKTGEILVIGTRWFERDLLSWIDQNEKYTSYTRAVKEDPTTHIASEDGEITFSEEFSQPELDTLLASMGPYMYSCLYMNKPVRSGDMIFQLDWFKYYDTLPKSIVHYTSVDPAGDPEDTKGQPDFNVVATCAKDLVTGRVYLVDYFRAKCSPGELLDAFFRHVESYRPVRAAIEAVAYQKSLLYHMRERMRANGKYVLIEPITWGRKSKNARILGLQPLLASGQLLIQNHHREFVNEALSFPYGAHDDLIDCVSMQQGLWQLTRLKREQKRERLSDPFSVETAMEEIRQAHKQVDDFENLRPHYPLHQQGFIRQPNGTYTS